MASGSDLCCPVCHDVFTEPVLLSCSHSFCKACLRGWWRRRLTLECPVCKRISGRRNPPCNLALKNLCEAYVLERDQRSKALCSLHSEKLKLFCLDHQQPVCLVCRDSEKHTDHRFRPADEAARDRREELRRSLRPLQEKLTLFEDVKGNCAQTAQHVKVQARHAKRQITQRFKRLHEFLEAEEEARIAAVSEEEKQKREAMEEKMAALSREIAAISDTIRATEEELRAEDVFFLQNYEAAVERVQQCALPHDPQLLQGALIDEAKHLGNLAFNIWNDMNETDSYTPVILDPNTAHPALALSEDLSSVQWRGTSQLPDNPERFDSSCVVLGSEGFKSDLHSWEVEVGDSPHWVVGVAPESVQRKGHLGSQSGLWMMTLHKGRYKACSPLKPVFVLAVEKQIQRVRVRLDRDRGVLRFFDPDTLIHAFSCTSTETLFPFIGTSDEHLLKIRPDALFLLNNTCNTDDGDDDSEVNVFKDDAHSDCSDIFSDNDQI